MCDGGSPRNAVPMSVSLFLSLAVFTLRVEREGTCLRRWQDGVELEIRRRGDAKTWRCEESRKNERREENKSLEKAS